MTDFLLLTLYAPLASWGEIAVGETRGSWDRPSRSAVLGLLGAALGLTRENQAAHDALGAGYGIAVRLDAAGDPLSDYHTAQTVSAAVVKKRRPRTRAQLLDVPSHQRETILSRRAYRQDAVATVVVWVRGGAGEAARWTLEQLRDALHRPAFVLYAGRKANAFGAPLRPEIQTAGTLAGVLTQRAPGVPGLDARRLLGRSRDDAARLEVSFDALREADGFAHGFETVFRSDVRRDVPTHRGRWQFTERVVEVALADVGVAAAGGAP